VGCSADWDNNFEKSTLMQEDIVAPRFIDEQHGFGLFSQRAIEENDIIIDEAPLFVQQLSLNQENSFNCSRCLRFLADLPTCIALLSSDTEIEQNKKRRHLNDPIDFEKKDESILNQLPFVSDEVEKMFSKPFYCPKVRWE
jgi:hypothetical protein